MDPKRAFAATLKVLALAGLTISALHFTVGMRTADADTPRATCFHFVCLEGNECDIYVINHTCCYVQEEIGQPPSCVPESCLLGDNCSIAHD